jgi:type IV secretion system protein TrbL
MRAGMGGIGTAIGGATSQGLKAAAARVTAPFRDAAGRGQQAAWNAGRTSSPSSASPGASVAGAAAGAAGGAPAWARNLRSEQAARHRRHMAMQTVKDGDRPGGSANPDLSDKE